MKLCKPSLTALVPGGEVEGDYDHAGQVEEAEAEAGDDAVAEHEAGDYVEAVVDG